MAFDQSLSPSGRKLLGVGVAVVLGGAVTGFFAGTRTTPRPRWTAAPRAAEASPAETLPRHTYLERRSRLHGPSSRVTSRLEGLRKGGPKLGDPVDQSPELHQQAVLARAEARAFDGAPPVVPHPIDEQSAHSCIACHEQGLRVKDRRAPVMSHRLLDNCTACHVTVAPRPFGKAPELHNDFVGIESPGPGTRASEDAPPLIPHTTHMRDNCAACHGLGGPEGIRTSHPELQSCTQCHAPAATELPWRL